jgi:hypothetical protein
MRATLGLALFAFLLPLNGFARWYQDPHRWEAAITGTPIPVDFTGLDDLWYIGSTVVRPWGEMTTDAAYAEGHANYIVLDGGLTLHDFSIQLTGFSLWYDPDFFPDDFTALVRGFHGGSRLFTPTYKSLSSGFLGYKGTALDIELVGFGYTVVSDMFIVAAPPPGSTPEPSTALLLAVAIGGGLGLGWRRRRYWRVRSDE